MSKVWFHEYGFRGPEDISRIEDAFSLGGFKFIYGGATQDNAWLGYPAEYDALLARAVRAEAAYWQAHEHITEKLQPEFQRIADGEDLSWPGVWSEPYDIRMAAQRLATWWHGCFTPDIGDAGQEGKPVSPSPEEPGT